MSLNYDLTACDHDAIHDGDEWQPFVQPIIIFASMAVGIGQITDDNYLEFWQRLNMFERIHDLQPLTPLEHVFAMVGLRTNVFPTESRAKWLKRVVSSEMDAKIALADESAAFEVVGATVIDVNDGTDVYGS